MFNLRNLFSVTEDISGVESVVESIESAVESAAQSVDGFSFEPMNFVENLKYMGEGMACILIVIGVIIVATVLLNKLTNLKK